MEGVREYPFRGCPKSPTVCLRRTAKVPPTGVGFRAEGDPGSWGLIWPSGGGTKADFRASVVWNPAGGSAGVTVHVINKICTN